ERNRRPNADRGRQTQDGISASSALPPLWSKVAKNGGMFPRRSAANFACLAGSRNSILRSHSEYAVSCVSGVPTRGTNSVNDKYFGSHELRGREEVVQASSDRGFGYVFAGFSALVAALSFYQGGTRWPYWLAAAVMFALVAFYRPSLLAPLNRLWTKLGLVLFAVVSPLVLGIVYYGCITPVGWLMRLSGKDPLRLRFEPERKSYWVARQPPGPAPDSLLNQF